jgi:hypothetical protein
MMYDIHIQDTAANLGVITSTRISALDLAIKKIKTSFGNWN